MTAVEENKLASLHLDTRLSLRGKTTSCTQLAVAVNKKTRRPPSLGQGRQDPEGRPNLLRFHKQMGDDPVCFFRPVVFYSFSDFLWSQSDLAWYYLLWNNE